MGLFKKSNKPKVYKERRSIFNGGLGIKTGFMVRKGRKNRP